MKKLLSTAGLLLFLFSTDTKGSLLVDPYIGYLVNQSEQTVTIGASTGTADFTTTGTQMGARVGWQKLGLMLGGEFAYSPTLTQELTAFLGSETSSGTETDYSGTYMGVFVGYDFPLLLRAWATYFFNVTYSPDGSGDDLDASGTSLGVGFTGLPFVSLNAEYRTISYDNSAIEDAQELFFSVSLPINL